MRGLVVAILLLSFLRQEAVSQVNEEDLLGTWFPVSVKLWNGDYSYGPPALILVFEKEGKGIRKGTGANIVDIPFTYQLGQDSLELVFEGRRGKIRAPVLIGNQMTIQFDSTRITDFIRLPKLDAGIELSEFRESLKNQTWELTIGSSQEPTSILYQFEDHVLDSGLTDYRLWSKDLGLRTYHFGIVDAIRQSWTVSQHYKTLILGIDREFSLMASFTLLLQSFTDDSMIFSYWDQNIEHQAFLKRLNKPSERQSAKRLHWLTQTKWQFYSEYIPPPDTDTTNIMDLGMVKDDFEELDNGGYKHDSTAVIQQTDLDERLLLLEFKQDRTYEISRENRILDQGTWKYFFNQTVIQLNSNKEPYNADGIYGGDIKIESIKRNEIKLYRNLKQLLDDYHSEPYSHLETYIPYRQRD